MVQTRAPDLFPRTTADKLKPLHGMLEGNLICPRKRIYTRDQVPPNDPSTKSASRQALALYLGGF